MVSDEARREIARMMAAKQPETDDRPLPLIRREWEAEARMIALPKGARFSAVTAGGVASEWMDMPRVSQDRVFLFLHGGGYNAGSPRTHRKLAANLARACGTRVLQPEYRLAPEHPFPAAVKDALMVYGWLIGEGGRKAGEVVVGGDSAGGGLALSMLLALREAKAPMPRGVVLMSPWTDLTVSTASYERLKDRDPSITQEELRQAGLMYAGTRNPADPMMSPLFADLRGLPPMLIHVGGEEVMLDDSRMLADRARTANVTVTYKMWPGLWHTFHHASPEVPEATQAIGEIAEFVRSRLG